MHKNRDVGDCRAGVRDCRAGIPLLKNILSVGNHLVSFFFSKGVFRKNFILCLLD
jgi:hypothetical protein